MPGRLSGAVLAVLAACGGPPRDGVAARYLHDPVFRRAELAASLVAPSNGYSRVRLARYGGAWEALPEWNPPVSAAGEPARALAITDDARTGDADALRALGEDAFARYPAQQLDPALHVDDAATAARYGLWVDGARIGGLVRVTMADGSTGVAYTCATCHAAPAARGGALVPGLANAAFDFGRLVTDRVPAADPALRAWGPGRADVAGDGDPEPVRIPDLRAIRDVTHLQVDATVAQRDVVALALRIETLLVVAHGQILRPPREVAIGLALYLWSLAPPPAPPPATDAERRGRAAFDAGCARCHAPPSFAGPPVALAAIDADDAIGRSPSRGTGTWRVPTLRGVATRGLLFHDGSLADVADVLDPARLAPGYRGGRRPGPVTEHRFGLDLDAATRADLVAYLRLL